MNVKEIEEQIERINTCQDCGEIDGCYICQKLKPNLNKIAEILEKLKVYA